MCNLTTKDWWERAEGLDDKWCIFSRGSQVTNRHCTHCTDKTAWSFEYKNVQRTEFPYDLHSTDAQKLIKKKPWTAKSETESLETGVFETPVISFPFPSWCTYLFFNSPENPSYINPFYGKLHLSANPRDLKLKRCMIEMIGFSEQRMFASLPSKFIVKWEKWKW